MNVSNSLQNSYTTALLQNSQKQSADSSLAAIGANVSSTDTDGDNDNESTESSSAKRQDNVSSGFSSQSIFSALNQNGSQGISTDQLLNALLKQPSKLSSNNNVAQNNNLQNILMVKILSIYDTTKTLTQSSKVISA